MKSRLQTLCVLAHLVFLILPVAAHADDLMLRIVQTQGGAAPQYEVTHAQRGHFAHQPPLVETRDNDLIVIGRDYQGRELFRAAVRDPGDNVAEVFDPATGAIAETRKIATPNAVVEVRMPYPMNLTSLDLLARTALSRTEHIKSQGADTYEPTPAKRLLRQELDALLSANEPHSITGAREMSKAAIVPTGSAMLWQSGPTATRLDIVLIGDGYASADQAKWKSDAQSVANGILADPLFNSHSASINIRRVDIVSPDSGVSEQFGAIPRNTALGTVVGCYGLDRLVCADNTLVANAVAAATPVDGRDQVILVANSTTYGGSGGQAFAALTMNPQSIQIALHEVGHSAFQLADEYDTGTCATTTEPTEADVTIQTTRAGIKWGSMIADSISLPTQPGAYPNGTVGLFTGAKYCPSGVYRPTENSRMRTLGYPWHAVNERRADQIFAYYNPTYVSNGTTGSLANGAVVYPASGSYNSAGGGLVTLYLYSPASAEFDLTLYWWNGTQWVAVAETLGPASYKTLSYQGGSGYYTTQVHSYTGSGSYTLYSSFPK